ncbi:MAG: DUF4143 domain-containing protein [Bacteroidales bacterium]|nr:DUF4143 domain-containing protein [Bacteroidales bacterium]
MAQDLKSHLYNLYYYDNKKIGEVDFLIDDSDNLTVLPIEVKSGKDYKNHKALDRFMKIEEYNVMKSVVLSNDGNVHADNKILYIPIYYVMFL